MPDENSNLNLPASARRPTNRRRGRRGGRGRGPRTGTGKPATPGEIAPEAVEPASAGETAPETEAAEMESPGGFREPHAETPAEFASHETEPGESTRPVERSESTPEPEPPRHHVRLERPERPPEPPPRQRQWVKPANFRPAAPTAITQAVEHATFIAEALKQLHEQLDEVLELVELAERQKLADEREIDELRRALRRIQPQRPPPQQQQSHQPSRGPRRDEPRRDEPRRGRPDPREQRDMTAQSEPAQRPEEPSRPPETPEAEPPPSAD